MNFRDYISNDVHSVGIAGHVRPDGDCIGSCLAVYLYIKEHFDVDAQVILEPIPHVFDFLTGSDEIVHSVEKDKVFDLFIALDCSDKKRLGEAEKFYSEARFKICIDHHKNNTMGADVTFADEEASSTCELVSDWIGRDNITKEIAECIYTGIVTDTGVFQYSCTHSSTMVLAGFLMDKGIDYSWIVNHVFFEKNIKQQKLLGVAMESATLTCDGRVIYSVITREDMERLSALPKHLEGISAQLRSTTGVSVSVFLQQNENGAYKISVRSDGAVDVAEVCQLYGGGGHDRAAGATIDKPLESFLPGLLKAIENRLNGFELQ